jgi:hypothetical protein
VIVKSHSPYNDRAGYLPHFNNLATENPPQGRMVDPDKIDTRRNLNTVVIITLPDERLIAIDRAIEKAFC